MLCKGLISNRINHYDLPTTTIYNSGTPGTKISRSPPMPPPPPDTDLDQTATEYFGPEYDDGESSTIRFILHINPQSYFVLSK